MNSQDPVGQAAMANTARQRGDYDFDDDYDSIDSNDYGVTIAEVETPDYSHWGIYRDEPRKSEAWRDFNPFEGYDWNNLKAKPKSKDE